MKHPKFEVVYPTPEEDTQLVAAAMSDPDNLPLTDAEWEAVKPLVRVGKSIVAAERPALNMCVDAWLLEHLRSTGKGWQTRVNALLREAVAQGRI